MTRILSLIGTLALVGCQVVEMDAQTAAAIATAAGDTEGAACFTALEPIVGTTPKGLLAKFEVARAGQMVIENGPCAPLAAGLLIHLLNKIPGTP